MDNKQSELIKILKEKIEEEVSNPKDYSKEEGGFKWSEHPVLEVGDIKIY